MAKKIAFRHSIQIRRGGSLSAKTTILTAAIIPGIVALCLVGAAHLSAQSQPGVAPPSSAKLSEQESRGEGLFLQRCSLCHLPRKLKFGSAPVIGPSLSGQFKDATPEQLKTLRGFILKGGPNMPGFQYGLDAKEVDDLIAFLKTL
jgi:mono/diheme cytochrome c family protein